MAAPFSPIRLAPTMTPRRAPSPTISPGGRRGRTHGSSEESRLRDLSPDTTLRAFTQRPMPFDTTCDEYKIFSCVDSLTAAERDLGARVAKAAQRLKSWCAEIEQWGWSGSFEPPSEEYRERRRRSLELRIREHVGDADLSNALPPLEYWGSLLSVEVESHEARLDDISEEMLKLDVEELKEYVLDMHPSGRSRPSSAGFEAVRQMYKPMDDFSFLITQTLLSALPHHAQLKERLGTWIARIAVLREVPRYLDDLGTAQKAMRLGWDAIDPPTDTSDTVFTQWQQAVDTISAVLGSKVTDLGKRLDNMLDTLEGRDDCISDSWIDVFEGIETDYGRWAHESRRRVIDFDVRRKWEHKGAPQTSLGTSELVAHSALDPTPTPADPEQQSSPVANDLGIELASKSEVVASILANETDPGKVGSSRSTTSSPITSPTAFKRNSYSIPFLSSPLRNSNEIVVSSPSSTQSPQATTGTPGENPAKYESSVRSPRSTSSTPKKLWFMTDVAPIPTNETHKIKQAAESAMDCGYTQDSQNADPASDTVAPVTIIDVAIPRNHDSSVGPLDNGEESDFEEGDTVVHNEPEDSPGACSVQSISNKPTLDSSAEIKGVNEVVRFRPKPTSLSDAPVIITNDGQNGALSDPPQTPRSRRDSNGSMSSDISFDSSPTGLMEDSPSIRHAPNRAVRAPRPELNAAMAKRRQGKPLIETIASAPWPPTQFSQKSMNSAEDLERKISDILTTIPAHIRLTSGPGADAPEVKPTRGLAAKGSRAYLRAARSVSGLKSPELTLSPAKNDNDGVLSGRKSAASTRADNDIKLYHLTQPGKEQPVKLFIRRVGENGERVMVRVGGGWADLGEYLRQYAEHHGRRTASEGKFEILGLEVKNSDSMNSPNRPESGMGKRDRTTLSPSSTPSKSNAQGILDDEAPLPGFTGTPGIAEEPSAPSTNSSQRSWKGDEVGLAGPKAKKLDLSGEKLEWIEGMMKQARTVSGSVIHANHTPYQREERADSRSESRSDSRAGGKKPEFGDLGKVGGTKRIFLRGGKPVME